MSQTVRVEKVDRKNGVICLVSMFPYQFMVLKLSKKVQCCNFVLTSARSLSILKQVTYMHLKGFALLKSGIVYYAMIYCFRDVRA